GLLAASQAVVVLPRMLSRNIGYFPHCPSQALVILSAFVYTISHEASHPSFEDCRVSASQTPYSNRFSSLARHAAVANGAASRLRLKQAQGYTCGDPQSTSLMERLLG